MPAAADATADITRGERFAFGENWRRFLSVLDEDRIADAERALGESLGLERLEGLTWLDAGSGSGLSSLAAHRLGAARLHAFDFDPASVACTSELRARAGADPEHWRVEQGSVLDEAYVASLGTFDVVCSWGVLHHTGDLWRALGTVAGAVAPGGLLLVAVYNDQGGTSRRWLRLKRTYNRLPASLRPAYTAAVMGPRELRTLGAHLLRGRGADYVRSWRGTRGRGMSRRHDLVDWIGGLPFEVARPEEVFGFLRERGFTLEHLRTCGGGLGCNEFVLRRTTSSSSA